jgi:uncharacterized protein YndB with AHSA1/START domain
MPPTGGALTDMATIRRTRTVPGSPQSLWETIRDPHHLPRWWPRVSRVEDVTADAFTELLRTASGKYVRADFTLVECDESALRLRWAQCLEGSPFARLLKTAETEVRLAQAPVGADAPAGEPPAGGRAPAEQTPGGAIATQVTIELRQQLNGILPRLGSRMVRRAAVSTIEEALDGLERIGG